MGLGSSKAPNVEIGHDDVQIPPWAAQRQDDPVVFFDMAADGYKLEF